MMPQHQQIETARRMARLEQTVERVQRRAVPRLYGIQVSTYGAVGDGVTNDAPAIQAAAAAAAAAGVPLLLDAKTYAILTTISLALLHGLELVGMGYKTVIRSQGNYVKLLLDDVENVTIRNLRIDGIDPSAFGAGNSEHNGIRIQNAQNFLMENVWCHNLRAGMVSRALPSPAPTGAWGAIAQRGIIRGNWCWSNDDSGIWLFRRASDVKIIGNHCWANGGAGIVLDDGTTGDEAAGLDGPITDAQVIGNHCNDNSIAGINIEGGQGAVIMGNHCNYNGTNLYFGSLGSGSGIALSNFQEHNPAKHNVVVGNVCRMNKRNGITCQGAEYNIISENQLINNGNGWASSPAATGIFLGSSGSYRCTTSAAHLAGVTVLNLVEEPATTGISGPEFVVGDNVYYTVTKTNPADPSEDDQEWNLVDAVDNTAKTITLTTPTTRAIAAGVRVTKPLGSIFNTVQGNLIVREDNTTNARSGIRIDDRTCLGNTIQNNTIYDLAYNTEYDWAGDISDNSGGRRPGNIVSGNRRGSRPVIGAGPTYTRTDAADHAGTVTLNGPTPVTVLTNALLSVTRIHLSRRTAASTPANTGQPQVYARTNFVDTRLAGSVLTAAASTGATVLTVKATTDWVNGATITVTLDTGGTHTTTINGTPGATSVTLAVGLPSAASIWKAVSVIIPAVAGSFEIVSNSLGDNGTVEWELDH